MAYVAAANFHLYVPRPALTSAEQTSVAPFLTVAQDVLNAYLGVATLEQEAAKVLTVDGSGLNVLLIGGRVIQSVSLVERLSEDQGSTSTITDYCRLTPNPATLSCVSGASTIDLYKWLEARPSYRGSTGAGYFEEGLGNFRVTGTFGCATIPSEIAMATAMLAQNLIQRSTLMEEVRSIMGSGQLTQFQDANWMANVNLMPRLIQLMVGKWRRREIH